MWADCWGTGEKVFVIGTWIGAGAGKLLLIAVLMLGAVKVLLIAAWDDLTIGVERLLLIAAWDDTGPEDIEADAVLIVEVLEAASSLCLWISSAVGLPPGTGPNTDEGAGVWENIWHSAPKT